MVNLFEFTMTVYSSLVRLSPRLTSKGNMYYITVYIKYQILVFFRQSSDHRVFPLGPSRFQWKKFKDHLHFYTLLGLIPCGLVLLYANVFIGPATLSEIPEDYEPKYWEYTRVTCVLISQTLRLILTNFYSTLYQDS